MSYPTHSLTIYQAEPDQREDSIDFAGSNDIKIGTLTHSVGVCAVMGDANYFSISEYVSDDKGQYTLVYTLPLDRSLAEETALKSATDRLQCISSEPFAKLYPEWSTQYSDMKTLFEAEERDFGELMKSDDPQLSKLIKSL